MHFALYALGALLLAWSGLTIVRGDGFGALDIAATLAGAGAIAIGLGAVTAAVRELTRKVASAIDGPVAARVEPAPAAYPKPAVALPPAPTLEEPPAPRVEEPQPEPAGPSRVEAAMAVKRGLRPAAPVARPRRDPTPPVAPEPAISRSPEPKLPKPATERRRWPVIQPAPAPAEQADIVEPPATPEPEPVAAIEPPPPETPAAPPPAAIAPPAPKVQPRPAPVATLRPAPPPAVRPKTSEGPSFAASTPEWLVRARARREARAQAEAQERAGQPAPTAPDEPAAAEPAIAASAEAPPPARVVLREGEHNGVTYRFLDDGSIEAESPHGMRRFSSIDELKETVAAARARGELGEPPASAANPIESDALDAALAALDETPLDETSRPA